MPGRWLTIILSRVREPLKRLNRTAGLIVACALLLAVGGLALLAHAGGGAGIRTGSGLSGNATVTASDSTSVGTTAPTDTSDATPHRTSTPTVYTGPNYMSVSYNLSSCHPGANSPYPYLDVEDTNPTTPLYWHLTLSDPAYTLYQNPPNPITPGPTWSDYFDFIGPMNTTASLVVTIEGSIGSWSGVLKPCAIATPTFPPIPVTITCATAQVPVDAKICVHTEPDKSVTADVVYCDGTHEPSLLGVTGPGSDSQGNATFDWIPRTTCYGMATATITAGAPPIQGTATIKFMVNGPAGGPTPTPPPTPSPTPPPPTPTATPKPTPTPTL